MALHTAAEIYALHIEHLMNESRIEDDDEGFYDLERDVVVEAVGDARYDTSGEIDAHYEWQERSYTEFDIDEAYDY